MIHTITNTKVSRILVEGLQNFLHGDEELFDWHNLKYSFSDRSLRSIKGFLFDSFEK